MGISAAPLNTSTGEMRGLPPTTVDVGDTGVTGAEGRSGQTKERGLMVKKAGRHM